MWHCLALPTKKTNTAFQVGSAQLPSRAGDLQRHANQVAPPRALPSPPPWFLAHLPHPRPHSIPDLDWESKHVPHADQAPPPWVYPPGTACDGLQHQLPPFMAIPRTSGGHMLPTSPATGAGCPEDEGQKAWIGSLSTCLRSR